MDIDPGPTLLIRQELDDSRGCDSRTIDRLPGDPLILDKLCRLRLAAYITTSCPLLPPDPAAVTAPAALLNTRHHPWEVLEGGPEFEYLLDRGIDIDHLLHLDRPSTGPDPSQAAESHIGYRAS